MNLRKSLPIFGVIALLLLAGCSGLNPISEEKTQAEQINESMNEVDSAQTRVTTVQNITIQGSNATLTEFQRQQVQTQYDFRNNTSVTNGVGEEIFAGQNTQYRFERFYDEGTVYQKRASTLSNDSTPPEWQVRQTNQSLRTQFTTFSKEAYFQNRTPNKTNNNQTLVYQIDLLNESNTELVESQPISPMDKYRDILDVYALEIYVNNSTNRLEEVRLYAFGELSNEELAQVQPDYENRDGTGIIEYALQIEFLEYNHNVDITIPEDAKNAE